MEYITRWKRSPKKNRSGNRHQLDPEKVIEILQSSGKDFAPEEAEQRLERFGPNEPIEKIANPYG